jgi:hypothetical protein
MQFPMSGGSSYKPRQDAMTSKQVMLAMAMLALLSGSGCEMFDGPTADPLVSPYPARHVWAIVPLRNESGSLQVDGAALADQLHRQLANASNLDVLPVNRVLEAMRATGLEAVTNPAQAMHLLQTLGADGLVAGTVTAYDVYDPPKVGMVLELYVSPKVEQVEAVDVRRLSNAATGTQVDALMTSIAQPHGPMGVKQPTSIVSAVLDAGDPEVRKQLERYANKRGSTPDPDSWRRYRVSMDLYCEFVSYVMSWRLLDAERTRLYPPPVDKNSPPPAR